MARQLAEEQRLNAAHQRKENWQRWGTYLSEREWGTVREDYSANGDCWNYLPHDHARSRAYRWGEDGLLGYTDRECRVCFAVTLWNERDPILKERLFGLGNTEGNHGEDVKEYYFYLDSTPTCSYAKGLYKYPQAEFPYNRLVEENRRRGAGAPEFELLETGVFNDGRYFDVGIEYAKAAPDDILIRLTLSNRGPEPARLHVLPTLWQRNTWAWGCEYDSCWPAGRLEPSGDSRIDVQHPSLGHFVFDAGPHPQDKAAELLFTNNETNFERLFGTPNSTPYVKDAFHRYVIHGEQSAINPERFGTKAAIHYVLELPPGGEVTIPLRLREAGATPDKLPKPFGAEFDRVFDTRIREMEEFYAARLTAEVNDDERLLARQAYAGLLWSRQFYHYVINNWLDGDPHEPKPPHHRADGRNGDWRHLFNRDVVTTPDKWEYPAFFSWDTAFHLVAQAHIDPDFAKEQIVLLLREWYMHPNGQIPACEYNFSDVNPPVLAWAAWRIYKIAGFHGGRDRNFLARVFHKHLLNFNWWVNRKDVQGKHIFAGGFLGLDNIGVFDRSRPLPHGVFMEQADGTAWMGMYCTTMLAMALELAHENPAYEDIASKFFEHFVDIADALNSLGGTGLWDEQDGFYYDQLRADGFSIPMRLRSLVGFVPLLAVEAIDDGLLERVPAFARRMEWFLTHRSDLKHTISQMEVRQCNGHKRRLLALPSTERLRRALTYLLDENEFLSPGGIRSMSKYYCEHPYVFDCEGQATTVRYSPGDSQTGMFGGNSNWRGPVWFPLNYLLLEALERYHHFYGESFKVEFPTRSGRMLNLDEVANELGNRLLNLFLPDSQGRRRCFGDEMIWTDDPHWRKLLLFHEFFHGDSGRGLGANHQTGWTALVARLLEDRGKLRARARGQNGKDGAAICAPTAQAAPAS
ncbi:MAG TPA: glucosidase [Pirellulales bacterium]|nr:glucosidase [Pirellulales bacterium]